MNLAGIDLNLLVALDALLHEGSVTRAAARVGLSQPAMSNALARLRTLLDDQLLVRTPTGMVPTTRARELAGPVRQILEQVERALRPQAPFDPATARRTFTVAMSDYAGLVILPPLVARLAAEAPHVVLAGRQMGEKLPREDLEAGRVDLALGFAANAPAELYRQKLFDERLVCVVRAEHPGIGAGLSPEGYAALPHVLVAPRGGTHGVVDTALSELGMTRRVVLSVPHFLLAPLVLVGTDYVLTVPERVAHRFTSMLPLRVLAPPVALPRFGISQVWHERANDDPAHRWLRSLLQDVCREV